MNPENLKFFLYPEKAKVWSLLSEDEMFEEFKKARGDVISNIAVCANEAKVLEALANFNDSQALLMLTANHNLTEKAYFNLVHNEAMHEGFLHAFVNTPDFPLTVAKTLQMKYIRGTAILTKYFSDIENFDTLTSLAESFNGTLNELLETVDLIENN